MTTMLVTTMSSILAGPDMMGHDYMNSSDQNMTHPNMSMCSADVPPTAVRVALIRFTMAMYAMVCVVGLLGNTLVIYVVLRFSKMQTVTNMYIVNLAVADECFLIGIPVLFTTMLLERWPFGESMCKVYMTTTSINQITSSIFLTIMSADRYVAVCHPISSPRIRTPFISKVVSLTAWTASALLMVPVFMYANTMVRDEASSCNILWPESENVSGQTAFTLYSFILGFAIPLVLIFVFYILVIRKLKTVGPKNKSKEKKKTHRKVTKMVLIVITVYVLCWLPYWIMQVALIFTPSNQCQTSFTVTVFLFTGCLSYSNSAMNPILYAFLSDNFKKSFMKACTCAAGKDVNAQLQMENSVYPRGRAKDANKNIGNALKNAKNNTAGLLHGPDDEDGEVGPLVSRADHSTTAITMTSRSNVSSEVTNSTTVKNGTRASSLQPTQL
ncbi:somatostatin receptor type 2-like [Thrips palmi]|uniref:Somatostatin receptor type 2-like n=1 Tax=Thrips palmi TaxID=161013 RepID=A0A6P9ADB9_THRPL|nr:somatostatin receptor type 2-like [Thrips palmi]XP_034255312.1 somatostatin receptor type 2-like [Thrips palmi]